MLHALETARCNDSDNKYVPYHERIGRFGVRHPTAAAIATDRFSKNLAFPFFARSKNLDGLLHFLFGVASVDLLSSRYVEFGLPAMEATCNIAVVEVE